MKIPGTEVVGGCVRLGSDSTLWLRARRRASPPIPNPPDALADLAVETLEQAATAAAYIVE